MPSSSCALRCSGTIKVQLCPSASEEEYPKVLVAAGFQSRIFPVEASATMTASRMAPRKRPIPRSCVSILEEDTGVPGTACTEDRHQRTVLTVQTYYVW